MPIRLIDSKAEIKIDIQGTTFVTKVLHTTPMVKLTSTKLRYIKNPTDEDFDILVSLYSDAIVSIDHPDCTDVGEFLRLMYMPDFMILGVKIAESSTVSEDESKN